MHQWKNFFILWILWILFFQENTTLATTPKKNKLSNTSPSISEHSPSEHSPSKEQKKEMDPKPILPPAHQWPENLIHLGQSQYYSKYNFIMDKSKRTLSLWKKENHQIQWVESFPADQGKKPGNKHTLGDLKTPEGIYFFQEAYKTPDLDFENYGTRAFTMDYPNFFDQIENKTGHGIWLHSVPNHQSLYRGSRGCIVVRIKVIEHLKNFINLKATPIIVENEVQYIPKDKHKKLQQEIKEWLFGWKKSWESKNINQYMSYYSNQFQSLGKNKKEWEIYKKFLNQKYNFINVSINDFVAYKYKNQFIVRFLQNYRSDQFSDYGEKFLYVKEYNLGDQLQEKEKSNVLYTKKKKYRIVGEKWFEFNEQKVSAHE